MSARIPARRLGQSVLALRPPPARQIPSIPLANVFQRHASTDNKDDNAADPHLENPVLEDLLRKKEAERIAQEKEREKKQAPAMRQGTMSKTSIFSQAREMPGWRPNMSPEESRELSRQIEIKRKRSERRQKRELSAMTLDPDRQARRRLERKLVLAGVKRRGRLTKAQAIARTERQNLFKSKVIPTSIKKLQKVVNQIAGKTVSEALVQLRFSKKKVARDVIKGLEQAHDEAITSRGMGLGQSRSALGHWQAQRANADAGMSNDSWNHSTQLEASSSSKNGQASKTLSKNKAVSIELKDGTRKVIKDPTEIYIDQAWIGPGETLKDQEFRARGKVNMIRHRTSTFSVLLKEEKTRVRLSEEIKKKRANRKLWNPLPDRPVTSQRQYCLW